MPFIPNTPESLLPRSDSKNPATTCKGITSSGRPCRRSLAAPASPRLSPSSSPSPRRGSPGSTPNGTPNGPRSGVVALLPNAGTHHEAAAAFFCWQHKDQAGNLAGGRTEVLELKGRDSIDMLAQQMGVLDVADGKPKRKPKRSGAPHGTVASSQPPPEWPHVPGPVMSVPSAAARPPANAQVRRKRTGDLHLSFFCCMRGPPSPEAPAPPMRVHEKPPPRPPTTPHPAAPVAQQRPPAASPRPAPVQPSASATQALLSLIPPHLPPATASQLLAELAKPPAPADAEPGYIYIFWHAPPPSSSAEASRSLLTPPTRPAYQARRTSEVLRAYYTLDGECSRGGGAGGSGDGGSSGSAGATAGRSGTATTVMLKIGRASNVQRRLNEWSRQCAQPLALLRYYPHAASASPHNSPHASRRSSPHTSPGASSGPQRRRRSSTPGAEQGDAPRKLERVARVERLIHLELAPRRVLRDCENCGRAHREWFEVPANREGLRAVDEVVRRWVGWGLGERT